MEFQCNLDCPLKAEDGSPVYCCQRCAESRKSLVDETNRHLWDDKQGFWSETGCRLPRDKMPKECTEYDCRKYTWVLKRIWMKGKWRTHLCGPILPGYEYVCREIEE